MFRIALWIVAAAAILVVSVRPASAQSSEPTSNSGMAVPIPPGLEPSTPGSEDPPTGVENDDQGKTGGNKFAALYETYASAWNNPKDLKIAALHKNRYDVVIFGKKYQKVAGHKVKVKKQKKGKLETSFDVELLDTGIALNGVWTRSFHVLDIIAQVFVGPVPVVISCGVGANFFGGVVGSLGLVGPKEFSVTASGTAGLGVNVAVGIGFPFGSIGVQGAINVIQGTLMLGVKFDGAWNVHSVFSVASSGEVNLVAKVSFFEKKYNLWKSPDDKVWVTKVLLDHTF